MGVSACTISNLMVVTESILKTPRNEVAIPTLGAKMANESQQGPSKADIRCPILRFLTWALGFRSIFCKKRGFVQLAWWESARVAHRERSDLFLFMKKRVYAIET